MIRLSRPEDRDAETIDAAKVEVALQDATGLIDDYIRGRYQVPIASPPDSVVRAACILARYDLAQGERTDPSEEMAKGRKEIITWLENIAKELINLDAPPAEAIGGNPGFGARRSDREAVFTNENLRRM